MKPHHLQDDDDREASEPAAAGSTVRAKRYHLHPELERIAEAAETGELSEREAYDQMLAAIRESPVLKAMPEIERITLLAAMRQLAKDPEVLAALRGERSKK